MARPCVTIFSYHIPTLPLHTKKRRVTSIFSEGMNSVYFGNFVVTFKSCAEIRDFFSSLGTNRFIMAQTQMHGFTASMIESNVLHSVI